MSWLLVELALQLEVAPQRLRLLLQLGEVVAVRLQEVAHLVEGRVVEAHARRRRCDCLARVRSSSDSCASTFSSWVRVFL